MTDQENNNAVLARDVHYISLSITEMKTTLTTIVANYLPRHEFTVFQVEQAKTHEDMEKRLRQQEETHIQIRTQMRTWFAIMGSVLGVVQAVVTAVIIKFFV